MGFYLAGYSRVVLGRVFDRNKRQRIYAVSPVTEVPVFDDDLVESGMEVRMDEKAYY